MAKEEHRAIEEEGVSGEGCPVRMHNGELCGRPIHQANPATTIDPLDEEPVPVDPTSVCLMHSRDPGKDAAEFQREFEVILEAAGEGVADFSGFVFPTADCPGRKFAAACIFYGATFIENAWFNAATFTQRADFSEATFTQQVDFRYATFTQKANFGRVTFWRDAGFLEATFTQEAYFGDASFMQDAYFGAVTFQHDVVFNQCRFAQKVSFEGTKFLGRVGFRETAFRHDQEPLPGPIFSSAAFEQPERVIFYKTYFGQALFHNCDVSRVNFSLVEWRRRKDNGKRRVFEEVVDLEAGPDLKPAERGLDERRYSLIAELYQQLKKNYDEKKDYWTAGEFHYGEMEMKRLATPHAEWHGRIMNTLRRRQWGWRWLEFVVVTSRLLGLVRKWWHQRLSLVAWYKYASQYGESYARPLWCLALVLLLFTFLFPIVGLDWNDTKSPPSGTSVTQQTSSQTANSELSYGHFSDFVKAYKGRRWLAAPAFFGNSLMTALSVAGFQKELKYEPSYPWGRALALLELLLTSTLAALFLLAVRRQFRR